MVLKKWYFDFLTPQSEYAFVYFAAVRLAGHTIHSLTVHLALPKKGIVLTRSIPLLRCRLDAEEGGELAARMPQGTLQLQESGGVLDFANGDCEVHLRFEPSVSADPRPVIIPAGRSSRITWRPLGLKYGVSGTIALGGERVEVHAAGGYVDYLESNCFPPANPVRTLYWGRLNHEDLDLVYMRAAGLNGRPAWSRLQGRVGGRRFESEHVVIEDLGPGNSEGAEARPDAGYRLRAGDRAGHLHLTVRHVAPVQQAAFINQQNFPSLLARTALKLLSRNPRSTKFLSTAELSLDWHGARRRDANGRDAFHRVPNSLVNDGDAVERLPTVLVLPPARTPESPQRFIGRICL